MKTSIVAVYEVINSSRWEAVCLFLLQVVISYITQDAPTEHMNLFNFSLVSEE